MREKKRLAALCGKLSVLTSKDSALNLQQKLVLLRLRELCDADKLMPHPQPICCELELLRVSHSSAAPLNYFNQFGTIFRAQNFLLCHACSLAIR